MLQMHPHFGAFVSGLMNGVGAGLCLQCQLACLCVCLFRCFQHLRSYISLWLFFSPSLCLDKSSKEEKKDRKRRNPYKMKNRSGNLGAVLWPFFTQILIAAQTYYSAWVKKELGWGILTCSLSLLLWSLGFPEVKPLTGAVWGIACCSPNCAGKAEAALCCGVGEEMRCRGGWKHLKPVLTPEALPCESPVFLMHIGAVRECWKGWTGKTRTFTPPGCLGRQCLTLVSMAVGLGAVSQVMGSWSMTNWKPQEHLLTFRNRDL